MSRRLWFLFVMFALVALLSAQASAASVRCGAVPATFQMTMGFIGNHVGAPMRARSLEAIAAIVKSNNRSGPVSGWIAWDDAGMPWIGFNTASTDLEKALGKRVVRYPKALFSPYFGTWSIPSGFAILACEAIDHRG